MTPTLPPGWSLRPPTVGDAPAILAVVHASDIAAVGEPDFSADEVVEILTAPNHDPARDSWVAIDASDRIVGWAYIHNPLRLSRENFDAYVHPELGRAAHPVLLHRVVTRIAERARDAGVPSLTARGAAVPSEAAYIDLLRSAGFGFRKRSARMRRELPGDLPPAAGPDGVLVRPVRPGDDAELRAFHEVVDVAFRDTPGYLPSTYEQYRQQLAALPGIDWDEWFVAEAGGRIVGVLQSARQPGDQGEAWVKYLAVRREFRGRGLGRTLLHAAFRVYAAKGYAAVGLGVDTTNPTGAYRLYESMGMSPVYEVDIYEREIPAAA